MTNTNKEKWFDDHVMVVGPDPERENALKEKLREAVIGHARTTDPQTSHAAANAVDAKTLERLVFGCVRKNGPIAADRVAQLLGLDLQSVSPRFRPLAEKGMIRPYEAGGQAITHKSLTSNRQRITWVAR